jgi:hypothetical protein
MTIPEIIQAIKAEPLTRLKHNSYNTSLVEAVREDIIRLIQNLQTTQ